MIFTINLKKYIDNTSIINIIIGKLCHRKKLCLIILFKVNKNVKINFHHTILLLNLSVCLWVKDGGEFSLDV